MLPPKPTREEIEKERELERMQEKQERIKDYLLMEEEFIRTRLFRPFDTTKGSQGMGIGAYQARSYVISAGGAMSVESAPGEGTRVRIELPVGEPQEAATDEIVDQTEYEN